VFVFAETFQPSLIFASKAEEVHDDPIVKVGTGNTKGGSITVLLTSCLTGLDKYALQIKTKIVGSHTADSKPVKQEANSTMILPPLVFPG
jgi:hypothetical protein